jgi:hypothetical protein
MLNPDNSRTAAMTSNNAFGGLVANPFYPLLPEQSQFDHQPQCCACPVLGRQHEGNDGKSVSGRPVRRASGSAGLTLGMSYTWSNWKQATEYLNAGDARPTKMISDLDATHRLSITGIFAFPFGKGKRFLSDASAIVDGFVGGWQIQGAYTYQTGFPVVFGTDLFYNGTDPVNGSDIALKGSDRSISKWFNTAVFTSPLNGDTSTASQPVNHLRTLPTRFTDVRSDSGNNVDLSLLKDVRLGGTFRLQVRFEFTNALNDPLLCASARAAPVVNPTSSTFGQVTNSNQANYPRRAQIGVKLIF